MQLNLSNKLKCALKRTVASKTQWMIFGHGVKQRKIMNLTSAFRFGIMSIILGSLFGLEVSAQGTLVLSNLQEPTQSTEEVASDAWLSVNFRTGDNSGGYRLDAVNLSAGGETGNPDGFSLSLYEVFTSSTTYPIVKIADLEWTNSDLTTEGILTFNGGNIILSPHAEYAIAMTAGTTSSKGSYLLNVADTRQFVSGEEWQMLGGYLGSANGLDWTTLARQYLQYAIYATPIPTVSINIVDDQIELRWEGFEGVTYRLQSRASLTDSEWTDVGGPLTGDGSELIVPVPVSSSESQSYYRVAVLPAATEGE